MVNIDNQICDTSGDTADVRQYTTRRDLFNLPDTSYFASSSPKARWGSVLEAGYCASSVDTSRGLFNLLYASITSNISKAKVYPTTLGTRSFTPTIDASSGFFIIVKNDKPECLITDESKNFCISNNILNTLNNCLKQVELCFEALKVIRVELDYFCDDEEFDNNPHVLINVLVNTSREKAESNYEQWLDWFIKDIPNHERKFFILTVDRE